MKWIMILTGILFTMAAVHAQTSIAPYHLAIGYNKTSNIIFPYAIKSVDRGSNSVLVQKAKGVDNILQVKAGKQSFVQTNLTVVTSDGQFYSFLVDYASEPAVLNLSFVKDTGATALLKESPMNEAAFNQVVASLQNKRAFLHIHTIEQKMGLALRGIYLTGHVMLFDCVLLNRSYVDYTPGYVRFFVRDKRRGKRTAVQETVITPMYQTGDTTVTGQRGNRLVFAFQPFTIAATQELVVQVGEQNGGRKLLLHISHRALLKARVLNN